MNKRYGIPAITLLLAVPVGVGAWYWRDTSESEANRLAMILRWQPGTTIAEIGAGKGRMSIAAAKRVGPLGHVFATELDSKRLAEIQATVIKQGLTNVTIIRASESDASLPLQCCDAIFMRNVYHHFTHPTEIDTSLFSALKPGGLLAIIDFPPSTVLGLIAPVSGVPKNRGGHGVPQEVLIQELTAAGFRVEVIPRDWPGRSYCLVFHKPGRRSASN